MYFSMSLRMTFLPFKGLCRKKNHVILHLNSYLVSQKYFSTNNTHLLENLQFPKHVQPLVNQSVDEILSTVNSKSVSLNESVSMLKVLRMFTIFKNINADSFKQDERFKVLCDTFERNCNIMQPNLLISGLRSLLEVGVSPDSRSVISAEHSIINNINLFSTFNIIGCLYFHYKYMETDLQKEVVSLLVRELCNKVSEIKSNAEVLMLVHFLHIFKGKEEKKIQQKIIELIPILNVHEICKMINALAENSNRNILVLNSISFHLRQKEDKPQLKEILDILHSFRKLNFFDINLLSVLMSSVAAEISSETQPSVISGLLTICGHLKLRHAGVVSTCAEWIISHIDICRPKELVSFILTVSTLNIASPEIQKALQTVLPLTKYEKIKHKNIWLDVVWSLAVLNIVDKEILLHVLSSDFYKPLIDNSDFQNVTNKMKLMNLKAVLKCYHPEYVFRCDLFLEPVKVPQSVEIENNRKHVLNVLSNFIPKDKYLCTNQNTNLGIFIDAEFIMSKSIKPLPLSDYGILSKVSDIKSLPKGAQRICLLILFYKDFTLYTKSTIGFIDFATRLLFNEGYTPVLVPFDEFMRNNTEVKKAKYLLQKISSTMKKVEDNSKFSMKLFL